MTNRTLIPEMTADVQRATARLREMAEELGENKMLWEDTKAKLAEAESLVRRLIAAGNALTILKDVSPVNLGYALSVTQWEEVVAEADAYSSDAGHT